MDGWYLNVMWDKRKANKKDKKERKKKKKGIETENEEKWVQN